MAPDLCHGNINNNNNIYWFVLRKYQSRERNFRLRITLTQQNPKILIHIPIVLFTDRSRKLVKITICVTVVPSSTHQPCFKITNWLPPTRLIIPASGEYCRSLQVIIILNIVYTTEIWVSAAPKSNFRQP